MTTYVRGTEGRLIMSTLGTTTEMRVRECRRCPAVFGVTAPHCPQCGNCDYITVTRRAEVDDMPKTVKRAGRGRVKAVA